MRRYKNRSKFNIILIVVIAVLVVAAVVTATVLIISKSASSDIPKNSLDGAIFLEDDVKSDVVVHFVNNNNYSEVGVNDKENEVIKTYFTRYFASLGDFQNQSFDDLFVDSSVAEAKFCDSMLSYLCEIRSSCGIDMSYADVTCGVTYTGVSAVDGKIEVSLSANDYESFAFTGGVTSYTCDVEHKFVFTTIDGEYYLVSHSEISNVYNLMSEVFGESASVSEIEATYKDLINRTKSKMNTLNTQRKTFNDSPKAFPVSVKADVAYNPNGALDYAYRWVGKYELVRNPEYEFYDNAGGNCCNYVSQCLLNGGIPFDVTDYVWKWYGKNKADNTEREGYSSSWISSESFYQYCINNKNSGLVCDIPSNVYSGRVGDVIQYLSDAQTKHSAIITKIIYDEKGNVLDYLINCNTTDKVDFPMSAYGYTDFRLIRIIGYNN